MAKRFTETEKWKDPWFSNLTNDEKIVWLFLLDDCNHAGIWQVNLRRLNFECRTNYSLRDIMNFLENRICEISEEKWFIPKFISFQYPKFPNGSPTIKSAIKMLDKEGLIQYYEDGSVSLIKELPILSDTLTKGLDKGLDSVMDMDMDMETDTDTDLDKDLDMDLETSLDTSKDVSMDVELDNELWKWEKELNLTKVKL